jgi:hypothetical protein
MERLTKLGISDRIDEECNRRYHILTFYMFEEQLDGMPECLSDIQLRLWVDIYVTIKSPVMSKIVNAVEGETDESNRL